MQEQSKENWEERFDEKYCAIDVNECGYNENGEPDGICIVDKEGLNRYGLDAVKSFISQEIEHAKAEVVKDIYETVSSPEMQTNIPETKNTRIYSAGANVMQEIITVYIESFAKENNITIK